MQNELMTIFDELVECGVKEKNERTGEVITALPGGWSFKIDLSCERLPVPCNRRYYPGSAAAEVAWQVMGTKDPAFIKQYAPALWSKFVEDGELKTAYGYRWRRHFGRDQLALAVHELKTNPTNRQLFISAWDPATDGLGGPQPKNIPCPVGFTLSMLDGTLHCSVFIRSSDVVVGLPYDVMAYSLTMAAVASEVGAKLGTLHVTLAHPHYYDRHEKIVLVSRQMREVPGRYAPIPLLAAKLSYIEEKPHEYVRAMRTLGGYGPTWNPHPEVVV